MKTSLSVVFNPDRARLRQWLLANPGITTNTVQIAQMLGVDMERTRAVVGNFVQTQNVHNARLLIGNGSNRIGSSRVKRWVVGTLGS